MLDFTLIIYLNLNFKNIKKSICINLATYKSTKLCSFLMGAKYFLNHLLSCLWNECKVKREMRGWKVCNPPNFQNKNLGESGEIFFTVDKCPLLEEELILQPRICCCNYVYFRFLRTHLFFCKIARVP